MSAEEIIEATLRLPAEEQLNVIESVIQSLESPQANVDIVWIIEARRSLGEIRARAV